MARPAIRYVALPPKWPGRERPAGWKGVKSPFKFHGWARVEKELASEVGNVNGRDLTIALDIRSPGEFRDDGGIRSDARPATARVVVSFSRPDGRRLVFPCDRYLGWQENVWAIRVSLEALRAVDRHEVTASGEQYQGFAALPPAGGSSMTVEQATTIVAEASGFEPAALAFPAVRTAAVRAVRAKLHPDAGGSADAFTEFEEAARVLDAHYEERQ